MKDYLKRRKQIINNFNKKLPNLIDQLPLEFKNKPKNYHINSWFNVQKISVNSVNNDLTYKNTFPKIVTNCQKVKMHLTDQQKQIINIWFNAYTEMYNETLNYIRNEYPYFKNTVIRKQLDSKQLNNLINSIFLRSKLKTVRDNIKEKSQITDNLKNTKIHTHTLDYAIKQLISNIKSAITNIFNGTFKRFRIKFWKNSRPSKTIEIERQYILNTDKNPNIYNRICPNILGEIKYEYNNKIYQLPNITSNVKINYNSITNEYLLLIPHQNIPTKIENKPRNIISLDPGLRTFMTGLSECEALKIGTDINETIKSKIKKLNKMKKNKDIPKKVINKNEKIINRKIYNKVDELHWKTINFLTANFNNILLGDMSAKSIVKRSSSCLSSEMKIACLRTRFYEFKQRLVYKCNLTKTNFMIVDESYTSKICSNCGNYNDKLKGEKIYNCENCQLTIDRDINACRNIMIKSKL